MRTIEDLEHFVLAPGETLILRSRKPLSDEQLLRMRAVVDRVLPGRPVMVLPPEMDVCAGMIEVFGADPGTDEHATGPTAEEQQAALRQEIAQAYADNQRVYIRVDGEWFWIHQHLNPYSLADLRLEDVSLTKPSGKVQSYS